MSLTIFEELLFSSWNILQVLSQPTRENVRKLHVVVKFTTASETEQPPGVVQDTIHNNIGRHESSRFFGSPINGLKSRSNSAPGSFIKRENLIVDYFLKTLKIKTKGGCVDLAQTNSFNVLYQPESSRIYLRSILK